MVEVLKRELELVRLHADDNVACLPTATTKGEQIRFADQSWLLSSSLGPGFKIAIRSISVGEKIIKFGSPIGSATMGIAAGEVVHLHNLKSDYIATYTLDEGSKYGN
tara:strand:- start:451 stop:771 length:321 start_codon:yes stop_codon:yes gene_type:complete